MNRTPFAAAALLCLIGIVIVGPLGAQDEESAGPVDDLEAVWYAISEWYVDGSFGGASWDAHQEAYRERVSNAPDDETAYQAIAEMVATLGNDETFLIPPWLVPALAAAAGSQGPVEQEYAGVGIMIAQANEGVLVTGVFREAPAEKAGVLIGDIIAGVDGERFGPEDGTQAVTDRVRGPIGTEVTITFRDPDGAERDITITRGRIDLRPSVEARVARPGIGYIRLPALTLDLVEQASRALPSLLSTSGIALDLRGITGGTPDAMTVLAAWFLGSAQLGSIRTREESIPIPYREDAIAAYRQPVVVITDSRTSGVAEVLAATLREYGRARIVGETTRGGSQIARILELPTGALLHLVVAAYVTPKGVELRSEGVVPDVELELPDLATIRAGQDPFLDRAVEIIRRGGRI